MDNYNDDETKGFLPQPNFNNSVNRYTVKRNAKHSGVSTY